MDLITLGETMALFTPSSEGYLRYASQFSRSFAGAETNVAIGVSRFGFKTGWISKVGKDEFGQALLRFLRGEQIDVSQVKKDEEYPTGLMFKEYLRDNKLRVFYYRKESAASRLVPKDIDETYIKRAKYLFLSGITPALSDSCYETVKRTVEVARNEGTAIIFDPNLRRKLWTEDKARRILTELSGLADIVLPGVAEGEFLFGTSDVREIGESFLELGADMAVVKLGAKGAHYFTGSEHALVPGFKVERVIDPIGAGDAFAAGLITGFIENLTLKDAVNRANGFGAMVTLVKGDVEGLPERIELEQFISKASLEDVQR
ncbi:2-dehydro-3-deoxygluconokinase [Mesobacillus campisalis]|uniref:2-dehydro-3-deoxygluconokinase n=1 Tax=Mesobacillus campisalis TaxID=1408103 RepID=A0A0M2SLB3_9BACI|nr:sugar kinase [Mesobacillus campisalis]KKK33662.1 2-dehydro-3-deoxygluconokinase [Mesobacillus campisalis]